MRYEFFYWPSIQGRGEFVRLALEAAGADYVDVARGPGGVKAMLRLMADATVAHPPFAPPFLRSGKLLIAQTANVLRYIGERHGLVPASESGRLWAAQLQLTVTDFVAEVHDTHHPIASGLYYADQRTEARRRAGDFLAVRAPKYFGYFERALAQNPRGDRYLIGARLSYCDLSLFQMVEGLRYAFPRGMAAMEADIPRVLALRDRVAELPLVAAYVTSERRIAFNEDGIFRRYPELDREG